MKQHDRGDRLPRPRWLPSVLLLIRNPVTSSSAIREAAVTLIRLADAISLDSNDRRQSAEPTLPAAHPYAVRREVRKRRIVPRPAVRRTSSCRAATRLNSGHSTPRSPNPEAVGRAMTQLTYSYNQFDGAVAGPKARCRWFRVTNRSFAECMRFDAVLAASCY